MIAALASVMSMATAAPTLPEPNITITPPPKISFTTEESKIWACAQSAVDAGINEPMSETINTQAGAERLVYMRKFKVGGEVYGTNSATSVIYNAQSKDVTFSASLVRSNTPDGPEDGYASVTATFDKMAYLTRAEMPREGHAFADMLKSQQKMMAIEYKICVAQIAP